MGKIYVSQKDYGGLGIINTRIMNEALLAKWVWKLYKGAPDDTCCKLNIAGQKL